MASICCEAERSKARKASIILRTGFCRRARAVTHCGPPNLATQLDQAEKTLQEGSFEMQGQKVNIQKNIEQIKKKIKFH